MTDMIEHATMNMIIHAAFRRDLARFAAALTAFPAGSRSRADQLAAAWENFASQLRRHHTDEETIFFPAFHDLGADEALIAGLDTEHAAMAAALDTAARSMDALHADPSAHNAAAARAALDILNTVMQGHLDHEERQLDSFVARHDTTPRFKQAHAAVTKAHKGDTGTFIAWLTDGADPSTIAALRKQIPPPMLFVLTRVPGRHYRRQIATTWTCVRSTA